MRSILSLHQLNLINQSALSTGKYVILISNKPGIYGHKNKTRFFILALPL